MIMTTSAKIKLSKAQLRFMRSQKVILTKNHIIESVRSLFSSQLPFLKEKIEHFHGVLPISASGSFPKISKGENYLGMPWVMMDYPAFFSKEKIFAIRTFFWWGNYLSVTLHLSGAFMEKYAHQVLGNAELSTAKFYVSTGAKEWQHNIAKPEYARLKKMGCIGFLTGRTFVKLVIKIPLKHWDDMDDRLQAAYKAIFELFHTGG